MNRFEYGLAAKWVQRLFDLAPKDSGIDKIYFYSLTNRKELIGSNRHHPKSKHMYEAIVQNYPASVSGAAAPLEFSYTLPKALDVLALWLSIDGDDTQSTYKIKINEILLTPI